MGFDICMRSIAVAGKAMGMSNSRITEITGLPKGTINATYRKALERGFDPDTVPWNLCDAMLADAPRSGRPRKQEPKDPITPELTS
ncbi:hypothetical protein N7457_008993 [Penicillium paradoxum]|uniref:uncharacterized protein n=1 Tax=Penicillium paradoxum TaxID=176176 RepID=UPI0025488C65|nr:uncharacterized protein N7457_008993 [Penicillium paradoxum]KAJ5774097.1 hypothetical protein N7457_008993 [Penicillium paradoxum]